MRKTLVSAFLVSLLLAACGGGDSDGENPPAQTAFTVAGVIRPEALNRIDSDTNDPETPLLRNNTPADAQPVLSPAVIGGFVSAPGTTSRFGPAGDEWDYFRSSLVKGQQILLENPGSPLADLELYLWRVANGELVDASINGSSAETLVVPDDGEYWISVRAHQGNSNYLLRLDLAFSPSLEAKRGPRLSDAFVADEIIVRARPDRALPDPRAAAEVHGMRFARGDKGREQLWRIPENPAGGGAGPKGSRLSVIGQRWAHPEFPARHRTLTAIKTLPKQSDIASASANFIVRPLLYPNDPLQWQQWHHRGITLPEAWDSGTGLPPDREVIIAVVDTGVFLDHEDLRGRLVPGYDFISNTGISRDGDGLDPNPDDPGDSSQPGQSSWHGSHVAGIIAAEADNAIGVAGVSWGARIMPIRTLGLGGGTLYDTLQGIRYAAGLPNDSGTVPAKRADVINLSLGGGVFSAADAALYQEISDLGIFVLAAAGNSGASISYPAAYDTVLAVGATDAVNRRAPYSSYGPQLDLVAPGGDLSEDRTGDGYGDGILSTAANDLSGTRRPVYSFYQGTSMATAVASGAVALALSVTPDLTPTRFRNLLESGKLTDDLGSLGWDAETGWGQVNALKMLNAVREAGSGELPPLLSASPRQLNLGFSDTTADFSLVNIGSGQPAVTGVHPQSSWMSVTQIAVNQNGMGIYRVTVNRNALAVGDYASEIRITATLADDLIIPVSLRVALPDLTVDTAGRIYVLLVNETGGTVRELGINPENGLYPFRFEGVPKGRYRIAAGTDINDNRQICDTAEACGAYPTLTLYEQIDLERDMTALNFSVGFREQAVVRLLSRTKLLSDN